MVHKRLAFSFPWLPRPRDEIVRILPRPIEEIVLDVPHDRVDSILQQSFVRPLASPIQPRMNSKLKFSHIRPAHLV